MNFGECFMQPQDRILNISEKDLQQMRAIWTQRMDEEFGQGEDHGGGAAHWAAFVGDMRVLAEIVRDKTKYPEGLEARTANGSYPAHFAADAGHMAVIEFIQEKAPMTLCGAKNDGGTPAHYAAWRGHDQVVRHVRQLPASQNPMLVIDHEGNTLAHSAARGGRTHMIAVFTQLCVELLTSQDKFGTTPAQVAAKHGHKDFLAALPAETWRCGDVQGRLPSHTAAEAGQVLILSFLHQAAPGTLATTDQHGTKPAHCGASAGQIEVLKYLQEILPDTIKAQDGSGNCLAHLAATGGSVEVMIFLWETDPELLKTQNKNGRTPMHIAAFHGKVAILRYLYEKAPITLMVRDKEGKIPMDLAQPVDNNTEAVNYLTEAQEDRKKQAWRLCSPCC